MSMREYAANYFYSGVKPRVAIEEVHYLLVIAVSFFDVAVHSLLELTRHTEAQCPQDRRMNSGEDVKICSFL
jgi:hypothetical protein